MRNILIIIDAWNELTHKLEMEAKYKLIHFLSRIKHHGNWCVYVNKQHPDLDNYPDKTLDWQVNDVIMQLDNNLMFTYGVEPFEFVDYENTHYYYAGFHTQHCLFEKRLGINTLQRLIPEPYNENFSILADCTAANMIDPNDSRLTIPISPYDLDDEYIKSKLVESDRVWLG